MKSLASCLTVAAVVVCVCVGYARMDRFGKRGGGTDLAADIDSKISRSQLSDMDCSKFLLFFRNGRRDDACVDAWRNGTMLSILKNYPEKMIEALHCADNEVRLNVYREMEIPPAIDTVDMETLYDIVMKCRGDVDIRENIMNSLAISIRRRNVGSGGDM